MLRALDLCISCLHSIPNWMSKRYLNLLRYVLNTALDFLQTISPLAFPKALSMLLFSQLLKTKAWESTLILLFWPHPKSNPFTSQVNLTFKIGLSCFSSQQFHCCSTNETCHFLLPEPLQTSSVFLASTFALLLSNQHSATPE